MLAGVGALKRNPCGGLNFGALLFRRTPEGLKVRLRLYEEDAEQGAKLVYESAEL
jgi:hypothetical protein